MERQILLARHGESFGNTCKIIEGEWDIAGLTPRGKEQAHFLGEYLQDEGIDMIISGDLERQLQTAEIVNAYVKKDIFPTRLLRERGAGLYTFTPHSAINFTGFKRAQADYRGAMFGSNQETLNEVVQRISTLRDNLFYHSEKKILLVGSSWINSYFLNLFLEGDKTGDDFFILREQENASVHRLILDYRMKLIEAELNILPPERLALDKSNEKLLKPAPLQAHYGA